MRRSHKLALSIAIAGLLSIASLAAGPCVEHRDLENGLGHFRVSITNVSGVSGGAGTVDDPYDYPDGQVSFRFNATAYDKRGRIMDGQDGRLLFEDRATVLVFPGPHSGFLAPEDRPPTIQFAEGLVEGTEIAARNLFGRATVQVVDMHFDEAEPAQGLLRQFSQENIRGSYALGSSQNIYFDDPSLHNIQIDDWVIDELNNDYSALDRCFVEIDCRADDQAAGLPDDGHGKLVVTGIFNEGFFVTDVAGTDDGYNHLYVYNYSYPEDLETGDRLDRLVGTAANFSGGTQISFPAWNRAMDENRNPEPFRVADLDALIPPVTIDQNMCADGGGSDAHLCGQSKKNWDMEEIESARVRIGNLRVPDVFINCDLNGDLEVIPGWLDSDDPEAICHEDVCLKRDGTVEILVKEVIASQSFFEDLVNPVKEICPWEEDIPDIEPKCWRIRVTSDHVCSELSNLHQYGQWTVAMEDGAGPLISVSTRESLVDFDPTAEEYLGMTIDYLQGNLRHVRAARPRWIVMVGNLPGDAPDGMKP